MSARQESPRFPQSPFLEERRPWGSVDEEEPHDFSLLESETPFTRGLHGLTSAPVEYSQVDPGGLEMTVDETESFEDFGEIAAEADDEALSFSPRGEDREDAEDNPSGIAAFAADFAAERAGHSKKPVSDEQSALLQDYRLTIAGARARFAKKLGKAPFTLEGIGRAWMTSRQEETGFLYRQAVKRMADLSPPSDREQLIRHPLVASSDKAPVSAFTGRFAEQLERRYPKMTATNYGGHGSAGFVDRGYSLDLYIPGRDSRGFYTPAAALEFLQALNEAARAVNGRWRIIYNDFSVADAMNRAMGERSVIFVGKPRIDSKTKRATGLNWHGPDPLLLHFHLDIAPRVGAAPARAASISLPSVAAPATQAPTPSRELVRFAQRVLNVAEGEKLDGDGKLGPLTRSAIERFRKRVGLGGGVLDARTEVALVQRALEELAQQSMFAPGEADLKTEQAVSRFKAENGLDANPRLDAATYEALATAIERRATAAASRPPAAPTATGARDWTTVPGEQRMAYVVRRLVERYGYPENGAAGIVGNLWAESGVLPNRIEGSKSTSPMRAPDFSGATRDFSAAEVKSRSKADRRGPAKPGIGLAQWTTASRRNGLFAHAYEGQILDLAILENMDAQVDYLVSELKSGYARVDRIVRDPSVSVDAASDEVVYSFEIPGAILTREPPIKRLPRDHPSVIKVFEERRKPSHAALRAHRGIQAEADFALYGEEEEDEIPGFAEREDIAEMLV